MGRIVVFERALAYFWAENNEKKLIKCKINLQLIKEIFTLSQCVLASDPHMLSRYYGSFKYNIFLLLKAGVFFYLPFVWEELRKTSQWSHDTSFFQSYVTYVTKWISFKNWNKGLDCSLRYSSEQEGVVHKLQQSRGSLQRHCASEVPALSYISSPASCLLQGTYNSS